jgi:hypothetical protein
VGEHPTHVLDCSVSRGHPELTGAPKKTIFVILSGDEASRSEGSSQSKDPYRKQTSEVRGSFDSAFRMTKLLG